MPQSDPEIMHIVLFKWREDASAEQIAAVDRGLRDLPAAIPGILELNCGANFCPRGQGFQTGLVVRFVNRAALDSYSPHPAHRRVVDELVNPIRIDSLAVDFEIT